MRQKEPGGSLSLLDMCCQNLVSIVERSGFRGRSDSDICLVLLQRLAFCRRAGMPYQKSESYN